MAVGMVVVTLPGVLIVFLLGDSLSSPSLEMVLVRQAIVSILVVGVNEG